MLTCSCQNSAAWVDARAGKERSKKIQLGRIAQGDNPAERQLDHKAITAKELCDLYFGDLTKGRAAGHGLGRARAQSGVADGT